MGINTSENVKLLVARAYRSRHLGGTLLPIVNRQNKNRRMLERKHKASSAKLSEGMDCPPPRSSHCV